MGIAIERERFEEADYARFSERLERSLYALRSLLADPAFGRGPSTLGAELELSLVDRSGRPRPQNLEVLSRTVDPRLTVELNRFNLECNLRYAPLAGRPFLALAREIEDALAEVRRAAHPHGARVAMVGILPTLRSDDLQRSSMTDTPRFRALSTALQRLREEPFQMNIDGEDPLEVTCDDVTFEGANTSLQLHLRIEPDEFARMYNAIQLATAPVLAVAGNSPTFLGHRLWEETRVALFKQSIDARARQARRSGRQSRVSFGSGWVNESALELFEEGVALHEPLLPILGDEDPIECMARGEVPRLDELRLHQGTVWRWNRGIYDPADRGHLRIEMRALPSGPSVVDMVANAAFLIGLALALAPDAAAWTRAHPFETAHRDFYRAAKHGLDAELRWPAEAGGTPEPIAATALIQRLLPVASGGLDAAGVDPVESEGLLAVIEARCRTGFTGARWQRAQLAELIPRLGRERALLVMLERYMTCSASGEPVHRWPETTP